MAVSWAASAFPVAIVCANVANILLARNLASRGEVATRAALGASRMRIARLHLAEALVLAVAALGIAGAWALTRVLANLLFGVTATDPIAFSGAVALLVVVALAACVVPARRAMPIDPMVALRAD
jgi:ABC-type antimicrobial peptide transport system permease subunit